MEDSVCRLWVARSAPSNRKRHPSCHPNVAIPQPRTGAVHSRCGNFWISPCDAANSPQCIGFYSVALLFWCSYNDMGCLRAPNSLRHCLHSAQRRCLATHSRSIDSISETPLSNLEKNVSLPYPHLQNNLRTIRQRLNRPLTLSEKILFSHLYYPDAQELVPGQSSLQLRPDRAACHDATATMAMLQFISAGLSKVALPTSIHSDHLIVAEKGAKADLDKAKADYAEVR